MSRTADYTIQGFLFQFHKALLTVLNCSDDDEVTVEGVIEDIEIKCPDGLTAIQCKYHETKDAFTLSSLYKPILQMMTHFGGNKTANIKYVIYAHFPNPPTSLVLTKADLEAAVASSNKELSSLTVPLRIGFDYEAFITRISISFGGSYEKLVEEVQSALESVGITKDEVEFLAYPNAVQIIGELSTKHDVNLRKIRKRDLVADLKKIRTTTITRWTLALKTKKQLLDARRKQLKNHLGTNARIRYFIINCASLNDFDENIVGFVDDYVSKYHFKAAHVYTPLFCFDCSEVVFRDIQLRLHKRRITSTDGQVGTYFDAAHFFRSPITSRRLVIGAIHREFLIRLIRWEAHSDCLANQKPHDLFIIGCKKYEPFTREDVSIETLETATLKEAAYLLGLSSTYE